MANIERLESTSTLLGLFDEWDCSMREQELSPGDLLALYTDGITEASDEQGEEFGERRLVEFLRQHRELSCQPLLTAIMDEVRRFSSKEQHDDITAIIAKFRERDDWKPVYQDRIAVLFAKVETKK